MMTTAYATTGNMISAMATSITLATSTLASGDVLVAWQDGADTYISLVHFEEGASAGAAGVATFASASAMSAVTFAVLQGVSADKLVAANFAFV